MAENLSYGTYAEEALAQVLQVAQIQTRLARLLNSALTATGAMNNVIFLPTSGGAATTTQVNPTDVSVRMDVLGAETDTALNATTGALATAAVGTAPAAGADGRAPRVTPSPTLLGQIAQISATWGGRRGLLDAAATGGLPNFEAQAAAVFADPSFVAEAGGSVRGLYRATYSRLVNLVKASVIDVTGGFLDAELGPALNAMANEISTAIRHRARRDHRRGSGWRHHGQPRRSARPGGHRQGGRDQGRDPADGDARKGHGDAVPDRDAGGRDHHECGRLDPLHGPRHHGRRQVRDPRDPHRPRPAAPRPVQQRPAHPEEGGRGPALRGEGPLMNDATALRATWAGERSGVDDVLEVVGGATRRTLLQPVYWPTEPVVGILTGDADAAEVAAAAADVLAVGAWQPRRWPRRSSAGCRSPPRGTTSSPTCHSAPPAPSPRHPTPTAGSRRCSRGWPGRPPGPGGAAMVLGPHVRGGDGRRPGPARGPAGGARRPVGDRVRRPRGHRAEVR